VLSEEIVNIVYALMIGRGPMFTAQAKELLLVYQVSA